MIFEIIIETFLISHDSNLSDLDLIDSEGQISLDKLEGKHLGEKRIHCQ